MNVLAVIPARYASTRFPGKPLALLGEKAIIRWVWEHVSDTLGCTATIVATDDKRIFDAVQDFGGRVMMTHDNHRSGTDRCGEVVEQLEQKGEHYDVIINVQGDEPFVQAGQLSTLVQRFEDETVQIATLRTPIRSNEVLQSPNNVKVVSDKKGRALYFSRHPLPYLRGVETDTWVNQHEYFKHVGIYAFRSNILKQLVHLPQGTLERCEWLEQLRWLEHGYTIHLCDTDMENIGIDTPEDLQTAEQLLNEAGVQ